MSKKTVVQILAKALDNWPEGADFIVQDANGKCWPSKGGPAVCKGGFWSSLCLDALRFKLDEVGIDCDTAKVTIDQWKEAREAKSIDLKAARARVIEIDAEIEKLADERETLMEGIRAEGFHAILPGPQKDVDTGVLTP